MQGEDRSARGSMCTDVVLGLACYLLTHLLFHNFEGVSKRFSKLDPKIQRWFPFGAFGDHRWPERGPRDIASA